jgi:hypothetical protein
VVSLDRLIELAEMGVSRRRVPATQTLARLLEARPDIEDGDRDRIVEVLVSYQATIPDTVEFDITWYDISDITDPDFTRMHYRVIHDRGAGAFSDGLFENLTPLGRDDAPTDDDGDDKDGKDDEQEDVDEDSHEADEQEDEDEEEEIGPVSPRLLGQAYAAAANDAPDLVSHHRDTIASLVRFDDPQTQELAVDTLQYVGSSASLPPLDQTEGFESNAAAPSGGESE